MNKLLYFALGFLVGGAVSYLYMSKKKKEVEDEFNDYLEYNNIGDHYSRESRDQEEVNPSIEDDDDIKERLMEGYEKTTNYAAMYKGEAANYEHPLDDDEEDDDEENSASLDTESTEDHLKNRNRPPKIISSDALGDVPSYFDKETLIYYFDDDVLANEEDEELVDQETYVGDALTKYGFKNRDEEETIHVLNYALDTLYTVQKEFKSYQSTVL